MWCVCVCVRTQKGCECVQCVLEGISLTLYGIPLQITAVLAILGETEVKNADCNKHHITTACLNVCVLLTTFIMGVVWWGIQMRVIRMVGYQNWGIRMVGHQNRGISIWGVKMVLWWRIRMVRCLELGYLNGGIRIVGYQQQVIGMGLLVQGIRIVGYYNRGIRGGVLDSGYQQWIIRMVVLLVVYQFGVID